MSPKLPVHLEMQDQLGWLFKSIFARQKMPIEKKTVLAHTLRGQNSIKYLEFFNKPLCEIIKKLHTKFSFIRNGLQMQ